MSANHISGQFFKVISMPISGVSLHNKIMALNIAQATKFVKQRSIDKRVGYEHVASFGRRVYKCHALHGLRALCPRPQGPSCHRPADKCDELAPLHVSLKETPR